MFTKSLIWIFIGFMLYSFCGELLLWQWQSAQVRQAIKHQLKAQIPANKLHKFQLTQAEFNALQWNKIDKEFQLENRLYDIVSKSKKGDSIILMCINDTEEESLFVRLDELVNNQLQNQQQNQNHKNNKSNSSVFWKIIDTNYLSSLIIRSSISNTYSYLKLSVYNQFEGCVLVPPPEVLT